MPPVLKKVVVGLAGRRGSGKTTIAEILALKHQFVQRSFGNVVRGEAAKRGFQSDLGSLQELGAAIIREWGWERFCRKVIDERPDADRLVLDGLRHVAAADTVRGLVAPARFVLVYVATPEAIRVERLKARGRQGDFVAGTDNLEFDSELPALRLVADLVVDDDAEIAAERIASFVTMS